MGTVKAEDTANRPKTTSTLINPDVNTIAKATSALQNMPISISSLSPVLTVPTLNASLSKVANQRKGILMGFASTAGNLSKVIAPLLAGYLYERSIELPYITMGAIALIGTIICFIWKKTVR